MACGFLRPHLETWLDLMRLFSPCNLFPALCVKLAEVHLAEERFILSNKQLNFKGTPAKSSLSEASLVLEVMALPDTDFPEARVAVAMEWWFLST